MNKKKKQQQYCDLLVVLHRHFSSKFNNNFLNYLSDSKLFTLYVRFMSPRLLKKSSPTYADLFDIRQKCVEYFLGECTLYSLKKYLYSPKNSFLLSGKQFCTLWKTVFSILRKLCFALSERVQFFLFNKCVLNSQKKVCFILSEKSVFYTLWTSVCCTLWKTVLYSLKKSDWHSW